MINYNYNDDLTINYKFQGWNKGKFTFGCLKNRAKQNKTKLNKNKENKNSKNRIIQTPRELFGF